MKKLKTTLLTALVYILSGLAIAIIAFPFMSFAIFMISDNRANMIISLLMVVPCIAFANYMFEWICSLIDYITWGKD